MHLCFIKIMKKIVSISELKIGMFVSSIVKANTKLIVKSQGMLRSQTTIESLEARGILELEIDFDKSDYGVRMEASSSNETNDNKIPVANLCNTTTLFIEQQQRDLAIADKLYTQAREIQSRFLDDIKNGQTPDISAVNNISTKIINSVFENADAIACLIMLKESSHFLVEHALNSAILMCMFAKYKCLSGKLVEDLTLAALLMDCGMANLPAELIDNTKCFNDADNALIQSHVSKGLELTRCYGGLSSVVIDILANHHERQDGSGYPLQKTSSQVSEFAQMAAIVDNYDSLLTDQSFRSSNSAHHALEILQKDASLNSDLVNEFIQAIGLFPVGSLVQLKSGKLAIVVQRNKKDPLQPVVMTCYSPNDKNDSEVKRIDLMHQDDDKIVGSVKPEAFDGNLTSFLKHAFLSA